MIHKIERRVLVEHPPAIVCNNAAIVTAKILFAFIAIFVFYAPVLAADITVDADCSLAEAIDVANGTTQADCETSSDAADTITITAAGTSAGTITLSADLPNISSTITIEGGSFTIDGNDARRHFYVASGGTLTVKNLTLTNGNQSAGSGAGGSIRVDGSTLTLSNVTLSNNTSTNDGGALLINGGTVTLNSGTTLSNNSSGDDGGAIRIYNSGSLTLNKVTLSNNTASDEGGAISTESSSLTIKDTTISSNTADNKGGAIYANAGSFTINKTTISSNTATNSDGGAIYVNGVLLTTSITLSTFDNNTSATYGGAIGVLNSILTVANSTFYSNSATSGGGGIDLFQSTITLTHVTMYNNSSTGNPGEDFHGEGSTVSIRNSIIYGGSNACNSDTALEQDAGNLIGSGNCSGSAITDDPQLGTLTGSPAYYPLLSDSPAIDAGSAAHCLDVDQTGESRAGKGTNCDIGAIEFSAPPDTPEPDTPEPDTPVPDTPVPDTPEPDMPVDAGKADTQPKRISTPAPAQAVVSTCQDPHSQLPESIVISGVTSPSAQCQHIGADGVGQAAILNRGFIDAVDVWSYLAGGLEVCFRHSGEVIFLDSAASPRSPGPVSAYSTAGMSCAWVDRPGTVVLVTGPAPPPQATATPVSTSLSGCMVTTTAILNFRGGPGGAVMRTLPYNVTLTALARTDAWFQVDYHGEVGWVSADYVTAHGSCG